MHVLLEERLVDFWKPAKQRIIASSYGLATYTTILLLGVVESN